ncbi:MAG: DEAD/DEAH box helicase [Bdellovibrionia bacterium]
MKVLSGLTLHGISQSESLRDILSLEQHPEGLATILKGQKILQGAGLLGYEISKNSSGGIQIKFSFLDASGADQVSVSLSEKNPSGPLEVSTEGDDEFAAACLVLLWWALLGDNSFLRHLDKKIIEFCQDFQDFQTHQNSISKDNVTVTSRPAVQLASVSLVFAERPLHSKNSSLESLLPEIETPWILHEPSGVEDPRNSALINMPSIFKKPPGAGSTAYVTDAKRQYQVASVVRFNFSDGTQITAADILRHPYKTCLPRELWPQPVENTFMGLQWPLLQSDKHIFVSKDLEDVEQVIQQLLKKIATKLSQGSLKVYLQADFLMRRAQEIKEISFDAGLEFSWAVEFGEESHFKLSTNKRGDTSDEKPHFFESFALFAEQKKLVVYSWMQEYKDIKRQLSNRFDAPKDIDAFDFSLKQSADISRLLQFLRKRPLPVEVAKGTHHLLESASALKVLFNEDAHYQVKRIFQTPAREVTLSGFSSTMVELLHSLDDNVSLFLKKDLRDFVAPAGKKRDWDVKLLKHTGVMQYLTLETLMFHFNGHLMEQTPCDQDTIVAALHSKLHSLIVVGEGTILEKKLSLPDLVSKSALNLLEAYVQKLQHVLISAEAVYLPEGEFLFEGAFEREARWLLEVLKHMAFSTSGAIFKRSRTGLLGKIFTGKLEEDPQLSQGWFYMPGPVKGTVPLSSAIGLLQPLIPHGVKLFLNDQGLVELGEDDFRVDFQVTTQVESGDINWFDLNPRFFLQGMEVNPESFKNFGNGAGVIQYEGKYYLIPQKQIPSLKRLENFWLNLQKGQVKGSKKAWNDKFYQVPKNKSLELLALRASGYPVRGDHEWQKLCDFYDNLGTDKYKIDTPKSVKASLKPYQQKGIQWLHDLYELRLGALLADDMGLGKTIQTLTFLEFLRLERKMGAILVVVPSSLVYNWESEIQKFTPELKSVIFTSKDQERVGRLLEAKEDLVVITTYGLLMENSEFLAQYTWNVLIFDEAQNLKNITTRRTSTARMLNARFKICLTGTPMENHYGEYFSLVDLVVPGSLGTYEEFRRVYVNSDSVQADDIADLKLRTKPLVMRRTKKEILDQLPEKQETKVSIAFEEQQKGIYRDIALSYNQKIHDALQAQTEGQLQLQMLTALLRLRQVCSDPSGLPEIKYDKVPPKLETLMESLTEIIDAGESALVFTQFIQTLQHTEKLLKDAGIPVFVLHGSVTTKQRQEILRTFNETQGGAVLVMTLKTGGVGLNLTKASYVFHLEPWWNPAVENQATDRAHRLGQTRAVQVFRYIMHESLEEKMEILKARKNLKFGHLFSEAELSQYEAIESGSALSRDDFEFLLK